MTFHMPLTPTQPPPDFLPPFLPVAISPENGWYHGQLREKQGVFNSQYVQFRYSRKLISISQNLPTSLCSGDRMHLLSVNMQCCAVVMYVVLHNAIVIFECDKLFGSLFTRITSCPDDTWVGLSLLSWFINKHYKNFIASSAFWLASFLGSPSKRGRAWYILSNVWLQG